MAAMCLFLGACGEGVKLVQDTGTGGVVTYPYKENGHLLSPFRKEAFEMITLRCPAGYRIVKEGETRGRQRISDNQGAEEAVRERRWGIQFACK